MNKFKIFLTSLCCLALSIPVLAVTDKEMDEAKEEKGLFSIVDLANALIQLKK